VFWRSRHHNVINHFYYAESDGCFKEPAWKVFWYGMRDLRDVEQCLARSRARPATLADPA
jgi:acetylglutamate kinase